MKLLRQTPWVNLWESRQGHYVDSRYRCYEQDASADQFLAAWRDGSDNQRNDLVVAVQFFPYTFGFRQIVQFLTAWEEPRAGLIERQWFDPRSSFLLPHQTAFLLELSEHNRDRRQLVWETSYARIFYDGGAFSSGNSGILVDSVVLGEALYR